MVGIAAVLLETLGSGYDPSSSILGLFYTGSVCFISFLVFLYVTLNSMCFGHNLVNSVLS